MQADRPCNWISSRAELKNVIKVEKGSFIDISKEGLIIRRSDQEKPKSKGFDLVYPTNESVSWVDDFYMRVWDNDLQDRLILLVQVMIKDVKSGKLICAGYLIQDLVNAEGKIHYGQFEKGLVEPPISFREIDNE